MPRRAKVCASGLGGNCLHVILEAAPSRKESAPDERAEALGECVANRLPVNLDSLDGTSSERVLDPGSGPPPDGVARRHTVRVEVGLKEFEVPPLPFHPRPLAVATDSTMQQEYEPSTSVPTTPTTVRNPSVVSAQAERGSSDVVDPRGWHEDRSRSGGSWTLARPLHDAEVARLEAHRAFLRLAEGTADLMGKHLEFQLELIDEWREIGASMAPAHHDRPAAVPRDPTLPPDSTEAVLFDRRQCLELAVGSVAAVFGPEFAEVDRFPVRVRLPDEPLMLVDRILTIEGTPRSLQEGRIVTEHVVRPGAWYLDSERVAPCVAMEAGQADLVLSGYLGVDFETRGLAMYRLLDATVTFHRGLPGVGEVIRYDIRINRFFRQGKTILFRFEFDATCPRRAGPDDARWLCRVLHAPRTWPPARGLCPEASRCPQSRIPASTMTAS